MEEDDMSYEYECAVSGQTEEPGLTEEADGLEDMPAGWSQITLRKRVWNPKWQTIQRVKQDSIDALLSQIPEEVRESQRDAVVIQVEASLHALESSIPKYLVQEATVYVSDDAEVKESLDEVKNLLGIETAEEDEDL
jgi:hypothetical protein